VRVKIGDPWSKSRAIRCKSIARVLHRRQPRCRAGRGGVRRVHRDGENSLGEIVAGRRIPRVNIRRGRIVMVMVAMMVTMRISIERVRSVPVSVSVMMFFFSSVQRCAGVGVGRSTGEKRARRIRSRSFKSRRKGSIESGRACMRDSTRDANNAKQAHQQCRQQLRLVESSAVLSTNCNSLTIRIQSFNRSIDRMPMQQNEQSSINIYQCI
jgi:hypothetical protein